MGRLFCLLLGHRRSRAWAHRSSDGWRSVCARCGTRMKRVAPGEWTRLDRD